MALGVVALAIIAVQQAAPPRSAPAATPAPRDPPIAASAPSTAARAPIPASLGWEWFAYVDLPHELALPADAGDAVLTAIPDRYLNDPLPAVLRVAVSVRGTTGIAAIGPPARLVWTEGELTYDITSPTLTIPQLVDLASALR